MRGWGFEGLLHGKKLNFKKPQVWTIFRKKSIQIKQEDGKEEWKKSFWILQVGFEVLFKVERGKKNQMRKGNWREKGFTSLHMLGGKFFTVIIKNKKNKKILASSFVIANTC